MRIEIHLPSTFIDSELVYKLLTSLHKYKYFYAAENESLKLREEHECTISST